MGMLQEFKAFAMRGNVIDLAVGVVIGGAFGKIVSALVDQVIMPVVGYLAAGKNFAALTLDLGQKAGPEGSMVPVVSIGYGALVQAGIDFLIVALVIFVTIKAINRLQRNQAEAPATPAEPSAEIQLLTEIRDALKSR